MGFAGELDVEEARSTEGALRVLGMPTRLRGVVVGSLNAYRSRPYPWDDSGVAALEAHNAILVGCRARRSRPARRGSSRATAG